MEQVPAVFGLKNLVRGDPANLGGVVVGREVLAEELSGLGQCCGGIGLKVGHGLDSLGLRGEKQPQVLRLCLR
jgi:hypothetical protein